MNDDDLSPSEHADLRRRLVSGARGIKPAGAHRTAWIAASVAVVLVAGLSATAIGAANLLRAEPAPVATNSPTPSATPTETATPTPTPTSTASQPVSLSTGVMPFGGECSNALSDADATAAAGQAMVLSDFRWETGAHAVAGGIDCMWLSREEYIGATLHVYAYPDDSVPDDVRAVTQTGCEPTEDGTRIICDASGVEDDVWLLVRTVGWADRVDEDAVSSAYAAAARRIAEYPAPRRADPTSRWWSSFDCEDVVDDLDPLAYGYERVTRTEYVADEPESAAHPGDIMRRLGDATSCDLYFTSGSEPEYSDYATVWISIVPGGAVTFDTVETAEYGQPVEVAGSVSAMWVPGLDRYEGSWNELVVSDGVNVMMLSGGGKDSPEELDLLVPIAEEMLGRLG